MNSCRHDTSNFNRFPYTIVLTDKRRVVILYHENGLFAGRLKVSAETTIYELFYDLLYSDSWKEFLSDTWRPWVFSAIQNIYYFEEKLCYNIIKWTF